MKVATYNVNGVNGRLPVLLRWLEEAQPDVVLGVFTQPPPHARTRFAGGVHGDCAE